MAGFFDGLLDSVQNPLFLGGIGMMGGGAEGLQRGLLAGNQFAQQKKKQTQEDSLAAAVLKMDGLNEQDRSLFAASPDLAQTVLTKMYENRLKPDEKTSDQREFEMARQQGFKGNFMDYQMALKRAGASSTNIDMKQESAYDKEMGGLLAKEFVESQKQGMQAQEGIADLNVMQSALDDPNVYTGTGGDVVQALKKGGQTVFGMDMKGVPEAETIQRVSSKIALGLKDNLPGPMSDSDRKFLMELPANLSTSPEGARRIVALGVAQKQWTAERAATARKFAAANQGRLTPQFYEVISGVDQKYAARMSQITEQLRSQAQTAPRAPTTGSPIDALRQKYKGLE